MSSRRISTILVGSTLALPLALSAASCKRETRQFHQLSATVVFPENVPYNNKVRPGPDAPAVGSTSQPVDTGRMAYEPFGWQFQNNAQALSDGNALYEAWNCVGCHAHGAGGMAPPLIDRKWLYGADPASVFTTILDGRPNGMPSFRGRIPEYQIWELVAYVRSMSGQANQNAAPGREDHMSGTPPPNSMPNKPPEKQAAPTTGPIGGSITGQVALPTSAKPATKPTTSPASAPSTQPH